MFAVRHCEGCRFGKQSFYTCGRSVSIRLGACQEGWQDGFLSASWHNLGIYIKGDLSWKKPLDKVMEHDQTFFVHKDIEGTVVALYCPEYMKGLNVY